MAPSPPPSFFLSIFSSMIPPSPSLSLPLSLTYSLTQYPSSTRPVIKMLAVAMASYERWYKADKDNPLRQLMHSLWKGNKYLQNPTQMGLKLDDLTLMSSVYFVKAFWSIMEQDVVKVHRKYFQVDC